MHNQFSFYLEVYDNSKDQNGCKQVHQVRKVLSVESLTKSANFVLTGSQQVEQGNDGTFKFSSTSGIDRGRTESLPHDCLANICRNKERNSRSLHKKFNSESLLNVPDWARYEIIRVIAVFLCILTYQDRIPSEAIRPTTEQ